MPLPLGASVYNAVAAALPARAFGWVAVHIRAWHGKLGDCHADWVILCTGVRAVAILGLLVVTAEACERYWRVWPVREPTPTFCYLRGLRAMGSIQGTASGQTTGRLPDPYSTRSSDEIYSLDDKMNTSTPTPILLALLHIWIRMRTYETRRCRKGGGGRTYA